MSAKVSGMTCIKPIAPADDTAAGFPALSTRITARIQAWGTPKRRDASAIAVVIESGEVDVAGDCWVAGAAIVAE
jgi:hypothetical protein